MSLTACFCSFCCSFNDPYTSTDLCLLGFMTWMDTARSQPKSVSLCFYSNAGWLSLFSRVMCSPIYHVRKNCSFLCRLCLLFVPVFLMFSVSVTLIVACLYIVYFSCSLLLIKSGGDKYCTLQFTIYTVLV